MKHYNLKQQPKFLNQFYETIDEISQSSHPLAENYSRKRLNLDEFPFFNIVVEDDKIVAFGGLQEGRWGKGIGRVATRLWVRPDHRKKGAVPSEFNSKILMPEQIKWAEQNGYDLVFWSRQYPNNRNFVRMIERSNRNCPYGYHHEALPDVYNVCMDISDDESCWQKVAVVKLKNWRIPFDDRHTKRSD